MFSILILAYIYYSKGSSTISLSRANPDNTYIYSKDISKDATNENQNELYISAWKANFNLEISTIYHITHSLSIKGFFVYDLIINPLYQNTSELLHNPILGFQIKYLF